MQIVRVDFGEFEGKSEKFNEKRENKYGNEGKYANRSAKK